MNKIILQSFFISGCLHLIALVFCDVILCIFLVPYKYGVYDSEMRTLIFSTAFIEIFVFKIRLSKNTREWRANRTMNSHDLFRLIQLNL